MVAKRKNSNLITSRDNSLLRRARAVRDGKDKDRIFVEGLRLCEEALKSGLAIEAAIYSDQIISKARAAQLVDELNKVAAASASVSEKLLESISLTETPQGIVILAERPAQDRDSFARRQEGIPLIVVLHEINNPVNVGAIARTAEAAGATGIVTTPQTSDPFSPKALRGAMGATFHLPVWKASSFTEVVDYCNEKAIVTISADVSASHSFAEMDWRKASALVMGAESTGLSRDEVKASDDSVRIPMQGSAESLNVAVAAGIILYEAAAQRGLLRPNIRH